MRAYRKKTDATYDSVVRFLHRLVVLLTAAQFVNGWTMPHVRRRTLPVGLIAWHLAVSAQRVRRWWHASLDASRTGRHRTPLIGTLSSTTHAAVRSLDRRATARVG
jgi:cytochrome b561